MTFISCGDPPWNTKTSLQRNEPQSPSTPNPGNTSEWVQTYIKKKGEVLNWWQEFHHMGTKILNELEVQDLMRKQAVVFWLPVPNKERTAGRMPHPT